MKDLGGLRHPRKDSTNTVWRNSGFRGYADHMETEEFQKALSQLVELGERQVVAVMCAEGSPFRCHRSLLADSLTARGVLVVHLSSERSASVHELTRFAKASGGRIFYVSEREQATLTGGL